MPRRPLSDPTAVVARRGGAWFIDAVLCALAGAIPLLLLADAYSFDRPANGLKFERPDGDIAVFVRDTVIVLHPAEAAVVLGALALGILLLLVVLPGRRGWSPGHLAADLRIVRRDGSRVGIARALVRTLGWVVDILPGIPIVAYVSTRLTRRHQRVGDLMARSFVVDKRAAGRPVDRPLSDDGPATMVVAEAVPEPVPEPSTEAKPVSEPEPEPEPAAASAVPAPAAPPDGVPPDQPIWDRRNQRYVLWHSKAGRWLTHTDAGWAPFERAGTSDASPED